MAAALIDQLGNAKEAIQKSMQDRLKAIQELACDKGNKYDIKVDEMCRDSKVAESFMGRLENCDDLKIVYSMTIASFGHLDGPGNLVRLFQNRKKESERAYARWNKHSDTSVLYVAAQVFFVIV